MFFAMDLFEFYIDPITREPVGEENVVARNRVDRTMAIVSPTVVANARKHFGCPTMTAVPLEGDGGTGTAGSHWEARYANTELMVQLSSLLVLRVANVKDWFQLDSPELNLRRPPFGNRLLQRAGCSLPRGRP
jgi:hypothetical protein